MVLGGRGCGGFEFKRGVFEHVVEEDNEFTHHGGEGDDGLFAPLAEAGVEGFEHGVAPGGVHGGHVEGAAHGGASAFDAAGAVLCAAVAVVGGEAGEGGGFARGEAAKFGHVGQEHGGADGADAGDLLQPLGLCVHGGLGGDLGGDGLFALGDLFFEQGELHTVLAQEEFVLVMGGAVLLGDAVGHELGAAGGEFAQGALRRAGRGRGGGGDGYAKCGEHVGIDRVALGEAALGSGKGAHTRWEHDAEGDVLFMQSARSSAFVAARGFHNEVRFLPALALSSAQELDEAGVALCVIIQREGSPTEAELECGLGNVEAGV
jgi:hypothetical protein